MFCGLFVLAQDRIESENVPSPAKMVLSHNHDDSGVVKSLERIGSGPVGLLHTQKVGIKYKKPTYTGCGNAHRDMPKMFCRCCSREFCLP